MTFETNTISIKKYIFTHLKPTNFINNKRKSQSSVKNVKSKTKNRNLLYRLRMRNCPHQI